MKNKTIVMTTATLILASGLLLGTHSYAADDNSTPSEVYDVSAYTKHVEDSMQKLHTLHLRAFDKNLNSGQREKARREFFKISQGLVQEMHQRIMGLNVKAGAALSHTDVLLNTHLTMMVLDMLSELQRESYIDPVMRQ